MKMGQILKDKVAVVTGSGQGIGRAIALALAGEGASLVTNNRLPGTPGGDAETTAGEIRDSGGKAVAFFGNVAEFETANHMIQKAVDEFGRLDILVNNAGTSKMTSKAWDMTEEEWEECLGSHLKGSFNCIRHACAVMKEQQWGRIINTTSMAWLGNPPHLHYGAAKGGIVSLTRVVANEMGDYGVTCNAYCPNAATRNTSGDELRSVLRRAYEEGFLTREKYEDMINPPSPDTVGPLMVYLCTDEAAGINGRVFDVHRGEISIYSEPVKTGSINKPEGLWTIDELIEKIPGELLK